MTENQSEAQIDQIRKFVLRYFETTDDIVKYLKGKGFVFIDNHITQKNFPLGLQDGNIQVEIVDPDCPFTEAKGIEILKSVGLERPTYENALRFARQYGDIITGKKPFIVFLHEPWVDSFGNRCVLHVDSRPGHRELDLSYPGGGFTDDCVLAGVRPCKQPSSS